MRIVLADVQPKVRFALRVLLERHAGFEVVAETEDVEELLVQTETTCPDMVLLGWELLGLSADECVSLLHDVHPRLAVIVLSGRPETRCAALAAGADAFVSKADPPERLLAAIAQCSSA